MGVVKEQENRAIVINKMNYSMVPSLLFHNHVHKQNENIPFPGMPANIIWARPGERSSRPLFQLFALASPPGFGRMREINSSGERLNLTPIVVSDLGFPPD